MVACIQNSEMQSPKINAEHTGKKTLHIVPHTEMSNDSRSKANTSHIYSFTMLTLMQGLSEQAKQIVIS